MMSVTISKVSRIITSLITICLFCHSAYSKYSGGMGEPNDPYQIATAEDLMLLGETPEDYDKHFILTADIDLDPNLEGSKVFDRAVIAPDTNDTDFYYEFQGIPFSGVFKGNGHTISHVTIEGISNLGLFGQLHEQAVVSNVGLAAVYVNGVYAVGGLVGYNFNDVTQSHSTATVSGDEVVGGLVEEDYKDGGSIISSFWDTVTSGKVTSSGGTGKTTAKMQTANTFLEAGWDFVDEVENGIDNICWIDEGDDYPRLW